MTGTNYDEERVKRLEIATERLSANISGLATSLSLVAEISQRQAELEERAAVAESAALDATKATAVVQTNLDITDGARRRLRLIIIIGLSVNFALLAYTRYESVVQIRDRIKASYQACADANAKVESEVRVIEPAPPSPQKDSAIKTLRAQEADCTKLYGKHTYPSFIGFYK